MSEKSTPTQSDTSPLSMEQAAALIGDRLNGPVEADTPEDANEPVAEIEQDNPSDGAADPGDVEESSDVEEGAEPEAETAEGDDEVWEIDGQQYTADELRKSLLRHSDYTKKTQALAAEKQEIERIKAETNQIAQKRAQEIQALEAERKRYDEFLSKHASDLNGRDAQFAQIDWETLAIQNPAEYSRLDAAYKQHQFQMATIKQEQERRAQERQKVEAEQNQAAQQRLQEHLYTKYGWNDDKKRLNDLMAIRKTANAAGFSDQDLIATTAPGVWDILHKAAMYDQSTAQAKGAVKRDANGKPQAVKIVKPAASRSSSVKSVRNATIASKFAELDRTGDIGAAVEIMRARRAS